MNSYYMYDFYFNDWPNLCPSWNFAPNSGLWTTFGDCIFFALSIDSSMSVLQTWICNEEIALHVLQSRL